MKNKMEITISVCVGSSIVSFGLYFLKSFPNVTSANRGFRCPIACHCWLDVSFIMFPGNYHVYLPIVLVTNSHYILPILRYGIHTTVPSCVFTLCRPLSSLLL